MGKLQCLPPYTRLRLFLLCKHRNSQLSNQSTYIGRSKNQPPKKEYTRKLSTFRSLANETAAKRI